MSETKESCAKKKMRYNKKTKKCLATYASCKAMNKVYNKRTRRCAPKQVKTPSPSRSSSSSSRSRSRSSSREIPKVVLIGINHYRKMREARE